MTTKKIHYPTLLTVLLLVEVCSAFEVSMIYAALPTLNREFGNPASVSWVITSCFLVSAIAAALCGRLGDLFGRRILLIVVLILCAIGSLTSGFSSSLWGVIVGAGIQGVSGAVLALCFGLARQYLPAEKVPFAIGVIVAAAALGSGVGLLFGGWIVDNFSWNTMFMVSAAYAIFCAVLSSVLLPKDPARTHSLEKIDLGRGVLFAPAICGLLLVINFFPRMGLSGEILALAVASSCLLIYWVKHQLRVKTPLINLRLLAHRQIITAYACMAFVALGGLQIGLVMSMFLQQPAWTGTGFALTAAAAGAILLPSNLVGLIASPLSGRLSGCYGSRLALILGAAFMCVGWGGLMISHQYIALVGAFIIIAAFGFNMSYAAIPNLLIESVPERNTSEVTGISSVMRATFMAIGSQIIGVMLAAWTLSSPDGTIHLPSQRAYQILFGYVAVCSFLCGLLAWSLPRRDTKKRAS